MPLTRPFPISNDPDMSQNRTDMAISEHAAYTNDSAIENQVVGKANIVHTHVIADVTGLDSFLADKAGKDDYQFYSNGSRVKPIKEYSGSAVSTSGQFTFYLTSDGTSTGTAIFTSSVIIGTANLVILDPAGGSYREGSYTLSADKKSLTVAVKKESFAGVTVVGISVLGSNSWSALPAGVTGYISVKGT